MGCFDLMFEEASFRWKVRLANVLEFSWNLKSTFFWCVGGGLMMEWHRSCYVVNPAMKLATCLTLSYH